MLAISRGNRGELRCVVFQIEQTILYIKQNCAKERIERATFSARTRIRVLKVRDTKRHVMYSCSDWSDSRRVI